MKKIITYVALALTLAACSEYDDSIIREYTPDAIGDNSWTAEIDTTIVEDKDVPGLPTTDPEFRGTLVARVSPLYEGNLSIVINDMSTPPSKQQVLIRAVDDNHINFGLKNFILADEETSMPIGTIVLKNIEVKDAGNGQVTFEFEDNITILTGEEDVMIDGEMVHFEEYDWFGPFLDEIPVKIVGKGDLKNMNIGIDIVMEALDQVIHVDFIAN